MGWERMRTVNIDFGELSIWRCGTQDENERACKECDIKDEESKENGYARPWSSLSLSWHT